MSVCPGEQYSTSIGMRVKNRRHWGEILKQSQDSERPLQEYEAVKKPEKREKRRPDDPRTTPKVVHDRPIDAPRHVRERVAAEHARPFVK